MKTFIILFLLLCTSFTTLTFSKAFTAVASGPWNSATTWNGSGNYPKAGDDATIGSGFNVNLAANEACSNLTIQSGGTLTSSTFFVTVSATFTLSSGGNLVIGISGDGITSSGNTGCIQGAGTRSFNTGANYTYNGSSAQNTGNGLPATVNTLTINNSNASGVTLTSAVTVSTTLTLTSGPLTLGANNLTLGSATLSGTFNSTNHNFIVTSSTGYFIRNVSATDVVFPVGTSTTEYNPITLNMVAGVADNYSVRVATSTSGTVGVSPKVVNKQWTVLEATGSDSPSLQVTLQWNAADEVNAPTRSLFQIGYKASGYTYFDPVISNSYSGSGPYTITSTLGQTMSLTAAGNLFSIGETSALPVELSAFKVVITGRNVKLTWETKTEKNSDKFLIERKSANSEWTAIAAVKAAMLSNSPKQYSYTDNNIKAGKYQYRLRMVDNDGSYDFSKIIETELLGPANFDLSQNYPNPFNPSTSIDYQLPIDANVTVSIYSLTGQKVLDLVQANQPAGYYSAQFSPAGLSSGIYFYRINAVNTNTGKTFTSVKKMLYMK